MKSQPKSLTPFIAIVLTALLCSCKARKFNDDLTDINLKGKVKSWTSFGYETTKMDNTIDSNYNSKETTCYNIHEKPTSFFITGNLKEKQDTLGWYSFYDSEGRDILRKDKSGRFLDNSIYSINKNKCLVEVTPYVKIVYNRRGLRNTMYRHGDSGNLIKSVVYRYDKRCDLIEEINYQTNGTIEYSTNYSYDKNHQKKYEASYDSIGHKYEKMNYEYDDKGNVVTEIDSNVVRVGGAGVQDTSHVESNINILTFRYSLFDKNNNWLREDDLWNNKYPKSKLRKIEYYR